MVKSGEHALLICHSLQQQGQYAPQVVNITKYQLLTKHLLSIFLLVKTPNKAPWVGH